MKLESATNEDDIKDKSKIECKETEQMFKNQC